VTTVAVALRRYLPGAAAYAVPVGLLLILAALVRWHGQLPYPDGHFRYGDHYRYIALARQPFGSGDRLAHQGPFCWRLLTPLLVHGLYVSLGMPILTGFWLVTVAGLLGATLALEWVLRSLGLPPGAVVAGGLAFVLLGPATGFSLWASTYADALPLCLLILMLGCAAHRWGPALLPLAVLGVLAKETTLIGVLFAFAWAWSHRDRWLWRWALLAGMSAVALLLALHLLIPATNSQVATIEGIYLSPAIVERLVPLVGQAPAIAAVTLGRLLAATAGTWTMLLPVALLQRWHRPHFWRKDPAFVVLLVTTTAQVFVALDVERVVAYGAPAVLAACCWEIETLAQRWLVSRWLLWLPLLGTQAYMWLPYAGWPAPVTAYVAVWLLDWPHWVPAIAGFALSVALLVRRRWSVPAGYKV
jgi:hypothetical protein